MIGIIGGSGLYTLIQGEEKVMETAYGNAKVVVGKVSDKDCVFIPRHGKSHKVPPHKINHKAHIYALQEHGVTEILSVSAVGIISDYKPGDLVTVRDFIALHSDSLTYFDDFSTGLVHTDMSEPYSLELTGLVQKASQKHNINIRDGGVLAHTTGPRFETKAEIKAFGMLGANLVGMTSVQEAILANELKINFANIAIAANYATGISKKHLAVEEVIETAKRREQDIQKIISEIIKEH